MKKLINILRILGVLLVIMGFAFIIEDYFTDITKVLLMTRIALLFVLGLGGVALINYRH